MSVSIKKTDEENHFRETLLLFYPWKDEDKDLLGNFDTFKSHCLCRESLMPNVKSMNILQTNQSQLEMQLKQIVEGDTAKEEAIDS